MGQGAAAIIFDFDGLILDTETPEFDEWRAAFRERGQELPLQVWQNSIGTFGAYDPCAHLAELSGQDFDREALTAGVSARHKERCRSQPLLPGVVDRAREARAAGLGIAVASSSASDWVEEWLGHHRIRDLFDTVCTRDHVRRVKPAPDLLLLAASRLAASPERCVVFEDSPHGIRAARAAGMRCVAIPNALTRVLPLDEADFVLNSLADAPLSSILQRLGLSADEATVGVRPGGAQNDTPANIAGR